VGSQRGPTSRPHLSCRAGAGVQDGCSLGVEEVGGWAHGREIMCCGVDVTCLGRAAGNTRGRRRRAAGACGASKSAQGEQQATQPESWSIFCSVPARGDCRRRARGAAPRVCTFRSWRTSKTRERQEHARAGHSPRAEVRVLATVLEHAPAAAVLLLGCGLRESRRLKDGAVETGEVKRDNLAHNHEIFS